jgi:hypothetical protein
LFVRLTAILKSLPESPPDVNCSLPTDSFDSDSDVEGESGDVIRLKVSPMMESQYMSEEHEKRMDLQRFTCTIIPHIFQSSLQLQTPTQESTHHLSPLNRPHLAPLSPQPLNLNFRTPVKGPVSKLPTSSSFTQSPLNPVVESHIEQEKKILTHIPSTTENQSISNSTSSSTNEAHRPT